MGAMELVEMAALLVRPDAIPVVLAGSLIVFFSARSLVSSGRSPDKN
jgi:hypothetical protein